MAAGTRAVQQLKTVVGAVGMFPGQVAVNIPFVQQFLGEDGALHANNVMEEAADGMLDELLRLDGALRTLRG